MALTSAEMSGLKVKKETIELSEKFLLQVSGGKDGGSYGYTDSPGKRNSGKNAMNAVGFFCSQIRGTSPNTLSAFESATIIDKAGFQANDIYYTYYGTLAAYQHQGEVWKKWLKKMQSEFIKLQRPDGSWPTGGGHGNQMGKVIATALVTLCLEAHYRYTPLYGLGFEPETNPNLNAVPNTQLPDTPLFRHAKNLKEVNSPGNDTGPVITNHGDFIYFSSDRSEGFGGADIYRSRLTKTKPMEPENVGPEINSEFNEIDPALRMAGFHLLFNSDREADRQKLFSSKSKRLQKHHNYFQIPNLNWLGNNLTLILGLGIFIVAFVFLTRRALKGT